jgi:HlyD family secretion protein
MTIEAAPVPGPNELPPPIIRVVIPPPTSRGISRYMLLPLTALLILAGAAGLRAWETGMSLDRLLGTEAVPLETLAIDRGEMQMLVVETGTLESSNNETVKCRVEALIGTTGGAATKQGGNATNNNNNGGGGAGGTVTATTTTKSAATTAATKGTMKAGTAKAGTAKAGTGTATAKAGASASPAAAGAAPAGGDPSGGGSTTAKRPTIRSFTMTVPTHVGLRANQARQVSTSQTNAPGQPGAPGGGGGGRRGGGGGGGGGGMNEEKPGATRIISILPEGTPVKAGDVVCELDSASFRDAVQAQEIKVAQSEAWVKQAKAIVEVNEINLQEYRDGVYPQDTQLIKQYLTTCRVEYDRARLNVAWSIEALAKGMRSTSLLRADKQGLEQAEIALHEAEGMDGRLQKYTHIRLIKALEAKIEASKSDMLAQQSAYDLDKNRLERLKRTVENCTMKAPRDGVVIYAASTNPWGRQEGQGIQEGVTVREGQAIFNLPDPRRMRVRARINESKVAQIQTGQRASIQIDAFPGRPLMGVVGEITAIPAPANGPFSDTRIYYANVEIDSGAFDGLRPGLSAEVTFLVDARTEATRIPLEAVRWVSNVPYAALASPDGRGNRWAWNRLELGVSNSSFAEVVSGLKDGQRVIAHPESLPAPVSPKADRSIARSATTPAAG